MINETLINKSLCKANAKKLLEKYGPNNYRVKTRKQWYNILLSQFTNPLIYILIISAVIAYFLGEHTESIIIIGIVIINAFLGFFQEYKSERISRELLKYAPQTTMVIRDGKLKEINSEELVPGDIIKLSIGDLVPADARILTSNSLTINESQLTGESLPVIKSVNHSTAKSVYPANMVYAGSTVSNGSAFAEVINTGLNTEFGKLGKSLLTNHVKTDFEVGVNKMGNFLLKIIIVLTIFVFLINAFKNNFFDAFLFAIALAVGVIPESLPIIITISLSHGALKMAKHKVVVKRLTSIEDLGNMDVVCCDKTGTLTEGQLSLIKHVNLANKSDESILLQGALCNDNHDAIDKAIMNHELVKKLSIKDYEVIDVNDFDFNRRRMSVLVNNEGVNQLIVKGSPNSIIKASSYYMSDGKKIKLGDKSIKSINQLVSDYESDGYKVIMTAHKLLKKTDSSLEEERDLIITGLLIFLDPPKESTRHTLELFNKLQVSIKIISGDSELITKKVCKEVGLEVVEDRVITGEELFSLPDKEFRACCEKYNVFARINPEQKYLIVSALNREGQTVGYLGDGANDAPSIKAADVGISVSGGVGIAKEAADIILLENDLRVLAEGITYGRRTFNNVTKYIKNTVSANFGNMFTVAASSVFLNFIPLLPSQVLLNNLITDTPLMTISTDNVDQESLVKPKRWDIKSISKFMRRFGLLSSVFDFMTILPLIFFFNASPAVFRTAWFIESSLSEILVTFMVRTKKPFFKSNPSRLLLISSVISAGLIIAFTQSPLGIVFEFESLSNSIFIWIVIVLASYVISAELMKKQYFKTNEL